MKCINSIKSDGYELFRYVILRDEKTLCLAELPVIGSFTNGIDKDDTVAIILNYNTNIDGEIKSLSSRESDNFYEEWKEAYKEIRENSKYEYDINLDEKYRKDEVVLEINCFAKAIKQPKGGE